VAATCALALAAGATFDEAAALANHAAGIVVGKFGTASVNAQAFTLKAGSWLYVREQVQV
jgi:bifunctional ADP-heptose synthase (sugar kinase/adenylyltransferase)